ncbi:MAG TPA: hypothetical protein VMT89_13190, partial [Candidatus Acidoferrales bacterium]|nr:hypothetical protein [Candidatus Acidoferrales bacterium]
YTAAAVLSIAYEQGYAAIDGNIVRVLSRLFCLQRPNSRGNPHAALAQRLLDLQRPGDWNQALMELGETVCTPKAPRCQECPLHERCDARRRARVDCHPPPKLRRPRQRLQLEMDIVRDGRGRLLLERGSFVHLPHLWLLPIRIVRNGTRRRSKPHSSFRHSILHRDFDVGIYRSAATAAQLSRRLRRRDGVERALFTSKELAQIGRSSLLSKALAKLPKSGGR